MFWSTHGAHVERELSNSQMNPGDIVVQKENTTDGNDTSNHSNTNDQSTDHPSLDEIMSRFANRFEKQIRHVTKNKKSHVESGGTPEEKQGNRSTRKKKNKTRTANGKRGNRDNRSSQKSQASGHISTQHKVRPRGRPVEMVLDRIVINGVDQSF